MRVFPYRMGKNLRGGVDEKCTPGSCIKRSWFELWHGKRMVNGENEGTFEEVVDNWQEMYQRSIELLCVHYWGRKKKKKGMGCRRK